MKCDMHVKNIKNMKSNSEIFKRNLAMWGVVDE